MTDISPSDTRLVAFLHGELPPTERRTVAAQLRDSADARARLAVFEQVDEAVGEALDRAASPLATSPRSGFVRLLCAVAGLAAVGAVFALSRGEDGEASARNDLLELRVEVGQGGQLPLFHDGALELHWRNLMPEGARRRVRVLPFPIGKTLEQVRDDLDAATHIGTRRQALLPVVVTAEIRAPDGTVRRGRYAPDHGRASDFAEPTHRLAVNLRDFEVDPAGPPPIVVGQPTATAWHDEPMWPFTHLPTGKTARWYPTEPGTWSVELQVATPPTPEYMPWPAFAKPIVVRTTIVMNGRTTPWGEAHDGLSARLVWSDGPADAAHTPFALQVRNTSGRDRKYNYAGTTIAKIPQPLHYTLFVDDAEWEQIDKVPVVIDSSALFWPHPTGTVRTFVQRAGYWRHDGKTLAELPGRHRVRVRFHFEPSLWNADDDSIWLGKLTTPDIEVDVRKR